MELTAPGRVTRLEQAMHAYDGRLCVTYSDRQRLGRWLDDETIYSWSDPDTRDELGFALESAVVVDAHLAPDNLVTMNSTIALSEHAGSNRWMVSLVYPDDVDLVAGGVSVLDPLGTALLGRRVGELIQYVADGSQRDIRIDAVVYQPELAGASHL